MGGRQSTLYQDISCPMRQIFKIFFEAEGTKPWAVLLCLILGGIAEAVGIGSLLPVASTLLNENKGNPSPFESMIKNALHAIGVEPGFNNLILLLVGIMTLRSVLLFAAMTYAGISGARVTINLRRKLIKASEATRICTRVTECGEEAWSEAASR